MIDYELLKDIQREELLFSEWSHKSSQNAVPNIMNYIEYSNTLGFVVISEIIKQGSIKEIAATITVFINVLNVNILII